MRQHGEAGGLLLHSRPFPLHYDKHLAIEPLILPRLRWFLSGGIVAKINQPESVGHSFGIVEVKKPTVARPLEVMPSIRPPLRRKWRFHRRSRG